MRFGIFGDIHGNLEALEVVLNDMQDQGVTHPVCIGDVVGYGANPVECLELVRQLNCPLVKGNHDEEASTESDLRDFNPAAAEAIRWTRKQLSTEQRGFLKQIRYSRPVADFTIVHASLDSPEKWGYVFNKLEAAASFTYQVSQLCFFGHTHVPHVFIRDTDLHGGFYSKIKIQTKRKYFINVGSVGQPRDGDWRCSYAIYDTQKGLIELRRMEYDVVKAQKKIVAAGLPRRLAERLAAGR
ncbi:MAG TPA: metallophosphoesterase family protein [Verrucomicrobiae bacterium]|nr:metallophosphoesterase family protein [Verrucomicrobiae bacterium]